MGQDTPRRHVRWRVVAAAAAVAALAAPAGRADDAALAPYRVVGDQIPEPLAGLAGDAARGRDLAAGRRGNCLACHHMPIPEQEFHGSVGPDLAEVGKRLSAGQLRLRLVDPKIIDEATIMPAFYVVDRLRRVAERYRGEPILTAAEIEDLVAYLQTLTGEAARATR